MLPFDSRYVYTYSKGWINQILFLSIAYFIKCFGLSRYISLDFVLNGFIDHKEKEIDKYIKNKEVKFTDSNIMYKEFFSNNITYKEKIVLFFGGRNEFTLNLNFAKLLYKNLNINVVCFQYDGFYKSGTSKSLSYESYINTINEIYNMYKEKYDVYIIGYSLGCYGALLINEKEHIFLISPFYSLQSSTRHTITIDKFNLNSLLKEKRSTVVYVHSFNHDLINPYWHLTDYFLHDNVKINIKFGNHTTGVSNCLLAEINNYLQDN